jgi:hypothetical protein
MYRHPNHLDAKKNLEKDSTKLPRYYVLPKWHTQMSPQGGMWKSSVRPRLQEDAVPRRALQAGRDFKMASKLRAKTLIPDQAEKFAESQIPFPARRQKIPCSIR